MHVAVDILDDADTLRHRARAVARQCDEFNFRGKARLMQRAQKIGCENERSLEDGDNQQVLGRTLGDLGRDGMIALSNLLGGE
ncbi:hypothetical protein D3C87_1935970 [compost metagenome]